METDYRLSFAAKKKIQGHLPTKREIIDWPESKLMAFLQFIQFFSPDGVFKVTIETIAAAEGLAGEQPWWDEFMRRIDVMPGVEDGTVKKFYFRFLALTRVPLGWLKENPHVVTEKMFEIMDKNPRMQWASRNFKMVETEMGAQIVMMDQDELTDPGRKNATGDHIQVKNPIALFEEAKLNMLTALTALSKSIPAAELKAMTVKDRLAAFDKLMNTASKIMGQKAPNSVVFQQINVNKAGRDELERVALGYAESQIEES